MFLLCVAGMHSFLSLVWAALSTRVAASMSNLPMHAQLREGYLPAGPFGVLAAITHKYYVVSPPLWTITMSEIEVSNRVLVSVPMLLLAFSQPPFSTVAALLGLLASLAYSLNTHLAVSPRIAAWCERMSSPFLGSSPVPMRGSHAEYRRAA